MTDINKIIPEEAKQDLVDVNQLWDLMITKVKELIAESRKIDFGGVGGAKSIKEYAVNLKLAADNQQKLTNQASNYTFLANQVKELAKAENQAAIAQAKLANAESVANKETIEYRETLRKKNLEIKNEVIANNAAIGSLTHLRAQLNLTKQKYAEMSAEIRDGDAGKALLLQIQAFDAAVKKIEADTGVFARNVGNYNMVQHNMSQVVRELPALGIDFRTFVMAISNNIPMLQDSMNQMRASGKTTQQIWQAMAASLFSVNTLIVAGITALMLFSSTAAGAETSLGKLNDEVERDVKLRGRAIELYVDESAKMQSLKREVEDLNTSEERLRVIRDEIVREYPKTANNLKEETNLRNNLAVTIEAVNKGLLLHTQIKAAEELITEKTKEYLKGETSTWQDMKVAIMGTVFGQQWAAKQMAQNLKDNNENYTKETNRLFDFIAGRKKQIEEMGLNNLFGDDTKKDGTGGATTPEAEKLQNIKDLSREQFDLQTADLKRQIELNKELANDDSRTYEDRIENLEKYYDLKRQLILQTAEYEKQVGNKSAIEQSIIDENTQQQLIDLTNETLEIETKASLKSLENERAINEAKKQNLSDLTEWARQENEKRLKDEEATAKKRIELIYKVVQFGMQAADMLRSIRNSHHQEDMAELSRQDEANRNALDREIARIQRSTLSQQEKEEKIREAEAKSEIERRRIENERRDREQRAAAFDRDVAMFQMMLSMFQGIAKEVGKGGVKGIVTAAAITAFMGGIIKAAGGLRTPRYAEGTGNSKHPGGLAIVGDGKESERIDLPDGTSFFSPSTDTLMDLPKGTEVTPMSKLIEDTNGMLTPRVLNTLMLESRGNTARMERLMAQKLNQVKEAIENKPVYRTTFSNGYVRETMYRGNMEVKFIKKRL